MSKSPTFCPFCTAIHGENIENPRLELETGVRISKYDCHSEAFVHIATARRHHGLSTFYIKLNLFHQNRLGRDFELQNAHIVLFKSRPDLMQVSTLTAQLGLGSELANCYRDTTSVPYCHLLIDLSPLTEDRLRFCTSAKTPDPFLKF